MKNATVYKYSAIWNRIQDLIGKYFDTEVIHDDKYISNQTKSYKDEI